MTREEIEQAAVNHCPFPYEKSQYFKDLCIINRSFYFAGAVMVNEIQPYNAKDMVSFFMFCDRKEWNPANEEGSLWYRLPERLKDEFVNQETITFNELLKLWEDSKEKEKEEKK